MVCFIGPSGRTARGSIQYARTNPQVVGLHMCTSNRKPLSERHGTPSGTNKCPHCTQTLHFCTQSQLNVASSLHASMRFDRTERTSNQSSGACSSGGKRCSMECAMDHVFVLYGCLTKRSHVRQITLLHVVKINAKTPNLGEEAHLVHLEVSTIFSSRRMSIQHSGYGWQCTDYKHMRA